MTGGLRWIELSELDETKTRSGIAFHLASESRDSF